MAKNKNNSFKSGSNTTSGSSKSNNSGSNKSSGSMKDTHSQVAGSGPSRSGPGGE
ncbi:MAG TPA: hypothetical protein VN258_20155 [Mobilitalea sp.]|nr:hypothetical protein [Mobilitalea sp.]